MTITITITIAITVAITITITIKTQLRTGSFGANCWGGFAVHREVIAPHGGYMTSMDFLLKINEKST